MILRIIIWFGYALVNVALAGINSNIVKHRISTGDKNQINHVAWSFYYILLFTPMFFIFKNWYFIGGLILLHLSVFPVAYNLFMGLKPFNLSTTSKSITDRIMVKMGLKNSILVNVLAFIFSIALALL